MAELQTIAPSFHYRKMLFINNVTIACDGNKYISDLCRLGHRHNSESIHYRFNRFNRVNLSNNYIGPLPLALRGDALSAPAIPDYNKVRPASRNVCGSDNTVERRLPVP